MYEVHVNPAKNRLYIQIEGRYELPEFKVFAALVLQEAKKLKPGFGSVSEISGFTPGSEDVRLHMQSTMKSLKEMGLGRAVRISKPEALVSANQWQRTSRAVGYLADQVQTREEADQLLDKLEKTPQMA